MLVCGISDNGLRKKLLQESQLTLEKCMVYCEQPRLQIVSWKRYQAMGQTPEIIWLNPRKESLSRSYSFENSPSSEETLLLQPTRKWPWETANIVDGGMSVRKKSVLHLERSATLVGERITSAMSANNKYSLATKPPPAAICSRASWEYMSYTKMHQPHFVSYLDSFATVDNVAPRFPTTSNKACWRPSVEGDRSLSNLLMRNTLPEVKISHVAVAVVQS